MLGKRSRKKLWSTFPGHWPGQSHKFRRHSHDFAMCSIQLKMIPFLMCCKKESVHYSLYAFFPEGPLKYYHSKSNASIYLLHTANGCLMVFNCFMVMVRLIINQTTSFFTILKTESWMKKQVSHYEQISHWKIQCVTTGCGLDSYIWSLWAGVSWWSVEQTPNHTSCVARIELLRRRLLRGRSSG